MTSPTPSRHVPSHSLPHSRASAAARSATVSLSLIAAVMALGAPLTIAHAGTVSSQAPAPAAHDPRGRWITANGNLEVDIAPCGQALCGTVTKVLGNRSMSRDGAEMDPVDKRPALGMVLLRDFKPLSDPDEGGATSSTAPSATQWAGEIYNRENGKSYHCLMSVSTGARPAGELVLRAYIGLPLFGKTQLWQRAPQASDNQASR